jgi:tryptophan 2,3-dioxygenase
MKKDYSVQLLSGEGTNDYARYMRTDALLALQRTPEESVHRDELLFQVVHQSTELWLKLAGAEVVEASGAVRAGRLHRAVGLLERAALSVQLVTDQLEMMRYLSPWDFQTIRTVLGHGSGADSPGWRAVQRCSRELGRAFTDLLDERTVELVDLYRGSAEDPMFRLAEALVEWDERVSLWRVRHYKIVTRVIGQDVVGTQGTPVEVLAKLISHRFFPELWAVRAGLTRLGPLGADQPEPSS